MKLRPVFSESTAIGQHAGHRADNSQKENQPRRLSNDSTSLR
jgi:hypothetical protein